MDHQDHVFLLRGGVERLGGTWADLGASSGAFTLALAELLGPGGTIYAVDRDGRSLAALSRSMHAQFPDVVLHTLQADFRRPLALALPLLDGIVMANSLHFVRDKAPVLRRLREYLGRNGRFILVEYGTDRGNPWVPHPLSFETWATLARHVGFAHTELLATRPSRFLGQIYAALSRQRHPAAGAR